jgi:glutamate-5-semialdehyde dehydrogenase
MALATRTVADSCLAAQAASRELARAGTEAKNAVLERIAVGLEGAVAQLLEANAEDVEQGRAEGLTGALIDRLTLSEERIAAMAAGVREVAGLPDPVGELVEERTLRTGLELRQVRFPLGVVAVVYEARPNVTVDTAALCIKSGNAIVLRGSSYAARSNGALAAVVREALVAGGLPEDCVVLLDGGREELAELATQEGVVDLIIPRGGDGLKAALKAVATVPVLYAAAGNCHVYVHSDADLDQARAIAFNAKVQRPGVCNAAETLLVNAAVAEEFLPAILADLGDAGVELVGDERARAGAGGVPVAEASAEDWDTEYHDLKLAVGVVDSLEEAIEHVNRHGTGHSEAIVTSSPEAGERFTDDVDAAAVFVNASTRFTDGFEFGMGAEIGNSTQKLHARGPIGLRELTTTKYVVLGNGQVKE